MEGLIRAVCDDCKNDIGGYVTARNAYNGIKAHKKKSKECNTAMKPFGGWEADCPCGWNIKGTEKTQVQRRLNTHLTNSDGCIDHAIDATVSRVG